MNTYFKSVEIVVISILSLTSCKEQDQKVENTVEVEEIIAVDISAEKEAVATVMKSYQNAIENLTTEGTKGLFSKESSVFESGGVEGTYENYEAHHLSPELKAFDSFKFSDYKIDIEVDLPYAFVTETYIYTIGLKANKDKGSKTRTVEQKGVATSDLKKIEGEWKIIKTHTSARKLSKVSH